MELSAECIFDTAGDLPAVCEGRGGSAGGVRARQAAADAAAGNAAGDGPHPVGAPAAAPHRDPHAPVRVIPLCLRVP